MVSTHLAADPVAQRASEIEHFVCCYDETISYCGQRCDDSDREWVDEVSCPMCMKIDQRDAAEGGLFCPRFDYCLYANGEGPELP